MKKRVIVALAAIAAILVACGPKEDPIVEVTSVSLSQTTLSIAKGGTTTLNATVGPHNATDKTVTWSSSNSSVATVDKGTVSAIAVGTATITATASGKTATCEVTVTPKGITSIRLEQGAAELNINEVFTLVSSVEPADADETLTWSSSDENVAKVENGKITAVGKGKATITASTTRGSRNQNRLPSPTLLSMPIWHTRNSGFVLRYFSMMPLQFISPNPNPFSLFSSSPILEAS